MSELTLPVQTNRTTTAAAGTDSRQPTGSARVRTCIGCRQACARNDLLRVVATHDGKVAFDFAGTAWGRGAWVHARTDCLAKSIRGLTRAMKRPITQSAIDLHEALVLGAWRHVGRLVAAAKRAGQVLLGIEAVERACRDHAHVTLLLPDDKRAVAQNPCLTQPLYSGRVLIVPSMTVMGEWLGTQDCCLAALTDSQMAKAIARTIAIAQTPAPARGSRGSDTGTEVG